MKITREQDYITLEGRKYEIEEFARVLRNGVLSGNQDRIKMICKMAGKCNLMLRSDRESMRVKVDGIGKHVEKIITEFIPTNYLAITTKDITTKNVKQRKSNVFYITNRSKQSETYEIVFDVFEIIPKVKIKEVVSSIVNTENVLLEK